MSYPCKAEKADPNLKIKLTCQFQMQLGKQSQQKYDKQRGRNVLEHFYSPTVFNSGATPHSTAMTRSRFWNTLSWFRPNLATLFPKPSHDSSASINHRHPKAGGISYDVFKKQGQEPVGRGRSTVSMLETGGGAMGSYPGAVVAHHHLVALHSSRPPSPTSGGCAWLLVEASRLVNIIFFFENDPV